MALAPPPRRLANQSAGWAFASGAWLTGWWTLVSLLLPAWGLLKVVGLALFAPVMAWRWRRAGRGAHAAGAAPLAQAQALGVSVAGKSAMATHLPVMEEGGRMRYAPQSDALFIGMAPAEMPRYLIGVQLGFADGKPRFGGQVAAPVFAQVVRGLFPLTAHSAAPNGKACPMPEAGAQNEEQIR